MHRSAPLTRGIILGIAIAIAVAACSSGAQGTNTGVAQADTIGFAVPQDGAEVTIPFDVHIDASVPLGEPESGNHHAHLYFDSSTDAADYDIVYGDTWQVTRPLEPGQHTIVVALANPDHSLAGPTQTVTVMVGAGPGGGSSESPLPAPSLPVRPY